LQSKKKSVLHARLFAEPLLCLDTYHYWSIAIYTELVVRAVLRRLLLLPLPRIVLYAEDL
jgi:hypothetical protein